MDKAVIRFGFSGLGSDVINICRVVHKMLNSILQLKKTKKIFSRMIFYFCLLYEIESVYGQAAAYGSRSQQNWNVPRVTSLEKLPPFKSNDIIGEEKG